MEANDNGVTSLTSDAAPSPDANTQPSEIKNLKAEMSRKISKLSEQLNQLTSSLQRSQVTSPVEETEDEAPEIKAVKTILSQEKAVEAKSSHERDFRDAVKVFPELDQNSESHDPEFYQTVDKYFSLFVKADPTSKSALKDAVELAAAKSGKSERIIKEHLLKDEARRSRILAEGGSAPRESKKEKEPSLNTKNLQKLGIKNLDRLKERIKKHDKQSGE